MRPARTLQGGLPQEKGSPPCTLPCETVRVPPAFLLNWEGAHAVGAFLTPTVHEQEAVN